jgi:hypothetical protein
MTATDLLAECYALDIVLQPDGNQLDIDAPRGTLTSDLMARLREHKAELLVLLRSPPSCRCGASVWRDVQIHNGKSVRRDCAGCGRFIEFALWYGEPTGDQEQSS